MVTKKAEAWFEVDTKGLRAIQAGKPLFYIVRELIQNAFDEDVTEVILTIMHAKDRTVISCEDNSPIGFRDLRDAYTMYRNCYKRPDPTKRGRFDVGEKQAISLATWAQIETTVGTVTFDNEGRHVSDEKRKAGSMVTLHVDMTRAEYEATLDFVKTIIVPDGIKMVLNGVALPHKEARTEFETILTTELLKGDRLVKSKRKTKVVVYEDDETWLYEMGIPVCEIECAYSLDVDQRIPLGVDRDKVSGAYLQDLYAEVLNHTFDDIDEDTVGERWVREGMSDERVSAEAVDKVMTTRYGEKRCTYTPGDPQANDRAIIEGYTLVRGGELSKDEFDNIKKHNKVRSSHDLFGLTPGNAKDVKPNKSMRTVEAIAKKIAWETERIRIGVRFVNLPKGHPAWFGGKTLTFNVQVLGRGFFTKPVCVDVIDLIIHEVAHYYGMHTERAYLDAITRIGAKLALKVRKDPKFFDVEVQ